MNIIFLIFYYETEGNQKKFNYHFQHCKGFMLVKSCNADDPDFCDMRQWLCYSSREVGIFKPEIPLVEKNVVKCPL